LANIYTLSDKEIEDTISLSVIKIEYLQLKNIDISSYDAIIFTSKNAVEAINLQTDSWKNIPSYAIGDPTASVIKQKGGQLKFISQHNHGDSFAYELVKVLKDKKVLYPRALKVVSNLKNTLKTNNIICDEIVVYKTTCEQRYKNKVLPKNSVFIFSSPSTINCFFENFNWDDSFKAVCIGDTTKKYLPSFIKPYIAKETTLKSCVALAKELIKKKL